jgi:hypothetical protein
MSERIDRKLRARADRLTAPPGSRRVWSWVMFFACLGLFVILPGLASIKPGMLANVPGMAADEATLARRPDPARTPEFVKNARPAAYRLAELQDFHYPPPTAGLIDRVWNGGPLSAAHKPWANDCKVCHAVPFVQSRDVECLACHKLVHDHVDRTRFSHPANQRRCADCHWEHMGIFGMAEQNLHAMSDDCASCHADIKRVASATQLENVRDFADGHPDFRVQVRSGDTLERVRPRKGASLEEATALKFPHDVHLSEKGVRSPTGKVKMVCADCHRPAPDKLGFEPVTMARDCQSCHALKIEPSLSNREVPHGDVHRVLDSLREFYQFVTTRGVAPSDGKPLTPTLEFRRPGAPKTPRPVFATAAGDSRQRAAASAEELFEKTSCVICHEVSRVPGAGPAGTTGADLPQWKITPVEAPHDYLPKASFAHDAHVASECTSCHAAKTSEKAGDVLIPGIDNCRTCHAGNTPVPDKVPSDCGLCHSFHWDGNAAGKGWNADLPALPGGKP